MTSPPPNACVSMLFLVYWNACVLPGNASELRSWLGCRLLIPCDDNRIADSDSFKWFYKKDETSEEIHLYFQKKSGLKHYYPNLPKLESLPNRSLVIDRFTDEHQGWYWCKNCHQDFCRNEPSSLIAVHAETVSESQETVYILSGSSFTKPCPGELFNFKWTFEASNKTQRKLEQRSEMVTITTNKTLYVGPVRNTNAGKYTCWVSRCDGPSQKLLTINLCVITVYSDAYSLLSCNLTCDVGLNYLKDNSSLLKSHQTISVDVNPSGILICNSSDVLNEYITSTSRYTTVGVSKKTNHLMPVMYGLLAVFAFFILLAVISFCLKSRIKAAFPCHLSCCGFTCEAEEDSTVIYSSVIIRTAPETRDQHRDESHCVYSELKL